MNFFQRMGKGWEIAKISLRTLNENRSLLLFPIISSVALIVVLLSFFGGMFFFVGDSIEAALSSGNETLGFILMFFYYLISYFVIVFFNAALVHCSVEVFNGRETSLGSGLNYASSKIGKIFSWSIVSAIVGVILQAIHQTGRVGEFVAALIGGAWSIMTFFVVPIIIYEEKNVFDSVKESITILKEKWGESLGGSFGFGLISLLGMLSSIGVFMALSTISPLVGGVIAGIMMLITFTVTSAARTVFIAAVYNHINDRPAGHFESDTLDGAFFNK